MSSYRILVTGSRDWSQPETVRFALDKACADGRARGWEQAVIMHGGCPTGADATADAWAEESRVFAVVLHADWRRYGRRAGPKRNAEMIERGHDICLAFIGPCTSPRCARKDRHPSHGATGCAEMASAAGIPVRLHVPSTGGERAR